MIKKIIAVISIVLLLIYPVFEIIQVLSPRLNIYHPEELIVTNNKKTKSLSFSHLKESHYVDLNSLNKKNVDALLMLEDKRFYSHHGIDYMRTIKSGFDDIVSGKIVAGGSTITQQLARILYLNNEKSFSRKINEVAYARRLEYSFSKNKILELYLNNAFYGKDLYGIENASLYYFSKNSSSLKLNEAIALFSMLPSPNNYSPENDLELFNKNYSNCLYRLYNSSFLSISEYTALEKERLNFTFDFPATLDNNYNYFFSAMNEELKSTTRKKSLQGVKVNSTLDLDVQEMIIDIVNEEKSPLTNDEVAVVVMRPDSGEVLGYVGGSDFVLSPFDRAKDSKKQIGSVFKPFIYQMALENNMTPLTTMLSAPTSLYIEGIGEYSPTNSGAYANEKITMAEAIATSDNIYAVKTALLLGSSNIVNKLNEIGINVPDINPTIALGSLSISPLILASIYNCFASLGDYYYPTFYKEIGNSNSKTTYINKPKVVKGYFQKEKCEELSFLLRAPFDQAFNNYATPTLLNYQPKATFSAKTGTSLGANYVIAYNQSYTITVYSGTDDNSPSQDSSLAKRIFKKLADRLMEKKKDTFFTPSKNLIPFTLLNKNTGSKSFTYYR